MSVFSERLRRLADTFWELAGGAPRTYPRDLEGPAVLACADVVRVPGLCLQAVAARLRYAGLARWLLGLPDRPLHGLILAYLGQAVIFVEANDPPDERRFSIAHELAHYLLDYYDPRYRAVQAAGRGALAVLDGVRPPTVEERLHAILAAAPLDAFTYFVERLPDGSPPSARIACSESDADLLAFELLAPRAEVCARITLPDLPSRWGDRLATLTRLLATDFGLPVQAARSYAVHLAAVLWGAPGFRDWLER